MQQILLVDDSAVARSIMKRSLDICGIQAATLREAGNGREALSILKNEKIDLVITDLNMPELNGEELLKRMKSSPKMFEIPVIIITSLKNDANERELIREHALAVLSKPISLPDMHKVLSEELNLVE